MLISYYTLFPHKFDDVGGDPVLNKPIKMKAMNTTSSYEHVAES